MNLGTVENVYHEASTQWQEERKVAIVSRSSHSEIGPGYSLSCLRAGGWAQKSYLRCLVWLGSPVYQPRVPFFWGNS